MSPMKEQEKLPEKKRTKGMESSNQMQSSRHWLVTRMLEALGENVYKEITNIKKDIETTEKNWSEVKAAVTAAKNTPEGISSGVREAEDRVSNLEDREAESTRSQQQKQKRILKK